MSDIDCSQSPPQHCASSSDLSWPWSGCCTAAGPTHCVCLWRWWSSVWVSAHPSLSTVCLWRWWSSVWVSAHPLTVHCLFVAVVGSVCTPLTVHCLFVVVVVQCLHTPHCPLSVCGGGGQCLHTPHWPLSVCGGGGLVSAHPSLSTVCLWWWWSSVCTPLTVHCLFVAVVVQCLHTPHCPLSVCGGGGPVSAHPSLSTVSVCGGGGLVSAHPSLSTVCLWRWWSSVCTPLTVHCVCLWRWWAVSAHPPPPPPSVHCVCLWRWWSVSECLHTPHCPLSGGVCPHL